MLDTKRLIELGEEAEGRGHLDAQMIRNHKDAIELLVTMANEIGFNRYYHSEFSRPVGKQPSD